MLAWEAPHAVFHEGLPLGNPNVSVIFGWSEGPVKLAEKDHYSDLLLAGAWAMIVSMRADE